MMVCVDALVRDVILVVGFVSAQSSVSDDDALFPMMLDIEMAELLMASGRVVLDDVLLGSKFSVSMPKVWKASVALVLENLLVILDAKLLVLAPK